MLCCLGTVSAAEDVGSTTISIGVHKVSVSCTAGGEVTVRGETTTGGDFYTTGELTLVAVPRDGWRRSDTLACTGDVTTTVQGDQITLTDIQSDVTLVLGFEATVDATPDRTSTDDNAPEASALPASTGSTVDAETAPADQLPEDAPTIAAASSPVPNSRNRLQNPVEQAVEENDTIEPDTEELDEATIQAIAERAMAEPFIVNLEMISTTELTDAQIKAVEKQDVCICLTATVQQNGVDISDTWVGTTTLRLPFTLEEGADANEYTVVYLAPDGTTEIIDTTYEDGCFVFTVHHFSEYLVVRNFHPTSMLERAADYWLWLLWLLVLLLALLRYYRRKRKQQEDWKRTGI
jgi:hypothetical protein